MESECTQGLGECRAGWKLCWALEIDGRWFKKEKAIVREDGGEEGSNYVQGCMEEIWGENINCGVLHTAVGRGGDSGAEVAGGGTTINRFKYFK